MIEQRRPPARAIVTSGAGRWLACLGELSSVNVLVALLAAQRCGAEIYVAQPRLQIRRLVAVHAGDRPVRSHQRELGGGVIKPLQVRPGFG